MYYGSNRYGFKSAVLSKQFASETSNIFVPVSWKSSFLSLLNQLEEGKQKGESVQNEQDHRNHYIHMVLELAASSLLPKRCKLRTSV